MQTITHWNQIEQIPPFPPPHPQFMEGLVTTPHPGLAMEWSLCLSASPDLVPFLDRAIHATSSCTTQSGGEAGPTERGHQEVRELANIISSSYLHVLSCQLTFLPYCTSWLLHVALVNAYSKEFINPRRVGGRVLY